MIVESDSQEEVMQMVPPTFRQQVRVVKLNRFTQKTITSRMAELGGD